MVNLVEEVISNSYLLERIYGRNIITTNTGKVSVSTDETTDCLILNIVMLIKLSSTSLDPISSL